MKQVVAIGANWVSVSLKTGFARRAGAFLHPPRSAYAGTRRLWCRDTAIVCLSRDCSRVLLLDNANQRFALALACGLRLPVCSASSGIHLDLGTCGASAATKPVASHLGRS